MCEYYVCTMYTHTHSHVYIYDQLRTLCAYLKTKDFELELVRTGCFLAQEPRQVNFPQESQNSLQSSPKLVNNIFSFCSN